MHPSWGLVPTLVVLLMATPAAVAESADEQACERQVLSWISNVTSDAAAAEGGFQCAVHCVGASAQGMREGEPVNVDSPRRCAMRLGPGEGGHPDAVERAATPALSELAGARRASTDGFARLAETLVLHAGA